MVPVYKQIRKEIMAILNYKGVNKIFSNAVSKYINSGYVIAPFTDCDFGRSIKAITLVNKSKAIRVSLQKESSFNHSFPQENGTSKNVEIEKYSIFEMSGEVREYNGYLYTERFYCDHTVNETILYRYKKNVFCESINDLEGIVKKKFDRESNKIIVGKYKDINITNLPTTFIKKVLPKIQSVRGFKKANEHCITGVTLVKYDKKGIFANVFFTFKGKEGTIVLK